MSANGRVPDAAADGPVLRWPGRVLAAEDLRHHLNGHRELVLPRRAVVTPLAADELRSRGVRVTRQDDAGTSPAARRWGYAQERPYPLVGSAVQALRRDGLAVQELPPPAEDLPCRWAKAVAEC